MRVICDQNAKRLANKYSNLSRRGGKPIGGSLGLNAKGFQIYEARIRLQSAQSSTQEEEPRKGDRLRVGMRNT
jgi:hypothetical protein